MKNSLPHNHGLSEKTIQKLVFLDNGEVALSDVQYAALDAGVARGESLLVVSPTSTGKTQIGLWAMSRAFERGANVVYLVTHRALARQKFEDFTSQLLKDYLQENSSALVIATGDCVEDVESHVPATPLGAMLLVATYEKYLAMLSASGVPTDMRETLVICDEIQLLGDENRGQNVEVLLTFLKNSGWQQFVGLSAVLPAKDAEELSQWLNIKLITENRREKHLQYECWTENGMLTVTTEKPDRVNDATNLPTGSALNALSAVATLLKEKKPPLPIIVFCMRKKDTYDLAQKFVELMHGSSKQQMSLAFEQLPETSANNLLSEILEYRVACHNADLLDEERNIVEKYLLDGKLDIVFATSTLAAGVNFPLGAAVFVDWSRWDSDKRRHVPIGTSEFHNMAGRVGRMGFTHEQGRIIFFASSNQLVHASKYLAIGELQPIEPRVNPTQFEQLCLQLVSSGLCASRAELKDLICASFSALREQDKNAQAFERWPALISSAVDSLLRNGLILETRSEKLSATPVGKAIGHSGMLPQTGIFLIDYLIREAPYLSSLLPTNENPGDWHQLAILLFSACLASPEFRSLKGIKPTRFLPYPLEGEIIFSPDRYSSHLIEPVWQADPAPVSAAWLCCQWIDGEEVRKLEGYLPGLSAGMLRELYRNLTWVLHGLSEITTAAADKRVPPASRPPSLRIEDSSLDSLSKIPRTARRFSLRVQEGLPDDVLWMTYLCPSGSQPQLARHEIILLKEGGLGKPEALMQGNPDADAAREYAFRKYKPSPQMKSNQIRDICRQWKIDQRTRAADRHLKRAKECPAVTLVSEFYGEKGEAFERVFEKILFHLNISFKKLDDKTKTGAPDYFIELSDSPPLVLELKSKEGQKLVDYNKAVEVLAASEIHGQKDAFCVTLCHPGVDPSVAPVITACGRLSVVESADLGEAFIRMCEGALSQQQLWQWLATPGQALVADLPFRDYS